MTIRIIALYTNEEHKDIHVVYLARGKFKSAHFLYAGFNTGNHSFYYKNSNSSWEDVLTNYDNAILRKSEQYLLDLKQSLTNINQKTGV